jgi:hypothetical protein
MENRSSPGSKEKNRQVHRRNEKYPENTIFPFLKNVFCQVFKKKEKLQNKRNKLS